MNDRAADLETRVGNLRDKGRKPEQGARHRDDQSTYRRAGPAEPTRRIGKSPYRQQHHDGLRHQVSQSARCRLPAKELVLQESIRDFNGFKNLPPKSNKFIAIWDTAWAIVAVAVPAMRLLPAVQKLEKAAAIEMASAKAFMKTPKLTAENRDCGSEKHNVADVIVKANNIRDKSKKVEAVHTTVPSTRADRRSRYYQGIERGPQGA